MIMELKCDIKNRTKVNDNKDGIHQTESVINVNTKVNMELKCDI